MAASPQDDPFLEEVLRLFAQEAQEWLAQINDALLELEQGLAPERQPKQFETILRGFTNLGGSAATVELRTIEQVALALVPLLQAMRGQGGRASADRFALLREGLQTIMSTIPGVAQADADSTGSLDGLLQRISDATEAEASTSPESDQQPLPEPAGENTAVSALSTSVMDALLNLQRCRPASSDYPRNIIETVLRKVQDDSGRGSAEVDLLPTVRRILRDLERLDEQFLAELEERLPELLHDFPRFKTDCANGQVPADRVTRMLGEASRLHEAATSVGAREVTLFFTGLQVFLQAAACGRVLIVPQRFDAVEFRLEGIIPAAKQWVELGRVEIAEIEKLVCGQ